MIREDAITILKAFMDNPLFNADHKAAFNIAIHDIEKYQQWNLNELVLRPKDEDLCARASMSEQEKWLKGM